MDRIINDILNYMGKGYSVNEVVKAMKKDIDSEFRGDVDKFYSLVSNTFEKAKKKMTSEEYEKLKVLRKEHSEQLKLESYKKIADKVKEFTLEMEKKGLSLKEALAYAASAVANYEGLSTSVVRAYTKTVYPEFYDYYYNNKNITPEHFEAMAKRIIEKNMYESVAARMQFYSKMIEYLENNNPELLAQMRKVFNSHKKRNEDLFKDTVSINNRVFKDSKTRMIAEIVLEYRVPIAYLMSFINDNVEYFCTSASEKNVDDILLGLKQIKISVLDEAIKWYLYETVRENEYTPNAVKRFNEFAGEFSRICKTGEDVEKFVSQRTYTNIGKIKKRFESHITGEDYNLSEEEIRIIAKYIYKYGLSEEGISRVLCLPRFHKSKLIEQLQHLGTPIDIYLVSRLQQLNEYQLDLYNETSVGRLK